MVPPRCFLGGQGLASEVDQPPESHVTPINRTLISVLLFGAISTAPVTAEHSGSYLAGRIAGQGADFDAASLYFSRAFLNDPTNNLLRGGAVEAFVADGSFTGALPIAQALEKSDIPSEVARIVTTIFDIQSKSPADVIAAFAGGRVISPLIDDLIIGWAHVGNDDMSSAITAFNKMGTETGLEDFSNYHKALALAFTGDFGAADAVLSGDGEQRMPVTRRGLFTHAKILGALGRRDDALALIDGAFRRGVDPEIEALRAGISDEALPKFDVITGYADGVAEVFFMLAEAFAAEEGGSKVVPLQYTRAAIELSPTHTDAVLLGADILAELERHLEAAELLDTVPRDHPTALEAQLSKARAIEDSGDLDGSVEVLETLAKSYSDTAQVHLALGLKYAKQKDYEQATGAYDRALDLMGDTSPRHWFAYFERAISYERRGIWDKAEADFRRALELNPDQPSVLNYLGYSLLEENLKLDEALSLIEKAVSLRPDSGYIIDSLGWAYFLQGRYHDAVEPMERAVELEAIDPIVNDHLGDVYWAVGRKREAEFQWSRALSFDPALEDVDRIRRKLEVGLDVVRQEEGLDPIVVEHDG